VFERAKKPSHATVPLRDWGTGTDIDKAGPSRVLSRTDRKIQMPIIIRLLCINCQFGDEKNKTGLRDGFRFCRAISQASPVYYIVGES